ncbi:MAG: ABC transporter substrate-binding protein [Armatimonadetes bacterium]|nr:ABC transporter substrate-binding protein [Armatimonadota bacterium]
MMKNCFTLAPRAAAIAVGLVLLAAASPGAQPRPADRVRLGYVVDITSIPYMVGQEHRDVARAKYNLDVEYVPYVRTADQMTAFRGGGIDVAEAGLTAAALLHKEGFGLRVVRGWQLAAFKMLVRAGAPYQRIEDLRGRRVGVASLAGTSYVATAIGLRLRGLDPGKDVSIATAAPANLIAGLERGDLDAITLWEPFITPILWSKRYRVVADPVSVYEQTYGENFVQSGFIASQNTFEQRRDVLRRLNRFQQDMLEVTLREPKRANEIAARRGKGTLDLTAVQLQMIRKEWGDRWVRGGMDDKQIQDASRYLQRVHELQIVRDRIDARDFWAAP